MYSSFTLPQNLRQNFGYNLIDNTTLRRSKERKNDLNQIGTIEEDNIDPPKATANAASKPEGRHLGYRAPTTGKNDQAKGLAYHIIKKHKEIHHFGIPSTSCYYR